ncbi:PTD012 family protein [Aspergillus saccharolyticus JOP 1030-1]|uniref:DUF1907-domain-containing protein n=1 Tax=Aspergillus saccharolyticus JOP 1030-1 TaxID=1450539 RepID=A0A318Z1Q4_9EURO|nr:DUF1907-domain-containing protein [Aspergillus saccharolyticus JOP 1030-1]PYH40849.1 DUF1907-domain-containing protein [Aspergillus saccharolyticus JOP 1030-1]
MQKIPLNPPPLEELAGVIERALQTNFDFGHAEVVQCPDLRQPPFQLAAAGLSGSPRISDVGGQHHLFPTPRLDKRYSLLSIAQQMEMSPTGGFLIGAGAAPFYELGQNAELAPNLAWRAKTLPSPPGDKTPPPTFTDPSSLIITNGTRIIEIDSSRDDIEPQPRTTISATTNCALMVNLYGCEGQPGPVIKVTARTRTGCQNLTTCIRRGIEEEYGDGRPVSLGGVFLLKAGSARFHIMPDFPTELPFRDRAQLEQEWLTYHAFEAPVVCLTVLHSADPAGLGLRMEHTHCFETEGSRKGGHYHYDLQEGGSVEYEAYLNVVPVVYRIDGSRDQ